MNQDIKERDPLVSIIIPNFNRGPIIEETITSVLKQSYDNWECLIVDDCSTDNSIEIIKSYCNKDSRFKFYQRDREPKGAPTSRNIGLCKSNGEFIIFLDSDDLLAKDCLLNRVKVINDIPGFDFWVFPTAIFKLTPDDSTKKWNLLHKPQEDLIRFLLNDTPWSTTGAIWKREAIIGIEGFNENALCWQDWELHLRALLSGYKYYKSNNSCFDSFYRERGPKSEKTIGSLHNELSHIKFRKKLFTDFYYRIKKTDDRQIVRDAFSVLFFRIFLEIKNNEDKMEEKQLVHFFNTEHLYPKFDIFLFRLIAIKINNKYIHRKKNSIIYKVLKIRNKETYFNKVNSTYKSV
jgi:glycosyltransferase involved in cell wall biosynthesis